MSNTEDLARGLIVADAGRRVGWAKAFSAQHKIESLEDEVKMLWTELETLRRAYSRLLGFTQALPIQRSAVLDAELAAHFAAERTFRDPASHQAGTARAQEHENAVRGTRAGSLDAAGRQRRHKARQQASDLKLRDAGKQQGHHATIRHTSATTATVQCTCGEALTGTSQEAFAWRNTHLGAVVHGLTPEKLSTRAKREYDKRLKLARDLIANAEKDSKSKSESK